MVPKKNLVAVIDNDPDILEDFKIVLTKAGFDVVTAIDGQQGIELIDKTRPDIILCDMMMEAIDSGIHVAKDVKDRCPELPIILLSSVGDVTAKNIGIYELGFNGVFQKPVDFERLISTIKNMTEPSH